MSHNLASVFSQRAEQVEIAMNLPLIAEVKQPYILIGKDGSLWRFLETSCDAFEQCGARQETAPIRSRLYGVYRILTDKLKWKISKEGKKIRLYTDPMNEDFCVFRKGEDYPPYRDGGFRFSVQAIIEDDKLSEIYLKPEWESDD